MAAILGAQLLWFALSIAWNVAGMVLIAKGGRALGPTASLGAAGVLTIVGLGTALSFGRWPIVYAALSILAGAGALAAIVNAFTANPSRWPSTFWRYASVALNGVGVNTAGLGAFMTIRSMIG